MRRTRSADASSTTPINGMLSNGVLERLVKNENFVQAVTQVLQSEGIVTNKQSQSRQVEEGPITSPGPWKYKGNGTLVSRTGEKIGTFHGARKAGRRGQKNRNLIRQAPELLALAKKLAEGPVDDVLAKEARDLIDKAMP